MTAPVSASKIKVIEIAANLVYKQGWNATGINQILTEAQVPKGSFYYYFQSKEDLGVAIVKYQAELYEKVYSEFLLNEELSFADALTGFFEFWQKKLHSQEWKWGCPVANFSSETADTIEKIAMACRDSLDRFHSVLTQAIQRGQTSGLISSKIDPRILSLQISAQWYGSILLSKTLKSPLPFDAFQSFIKNILK